MNVLVNLTKLTFLPDFWYPAPMQQVKGRTALEHSVDSLGISAQYHFVVNWLDHTKYSVGNYLEATFPGAIIHITKKTPCDAGVPLEVSLKGPLFIFDGRSALRWNVSAFMGRTLKDNADATIATFNNYNRKYLHLRLGGYHRNSVAKIVPDRISNVAVAGLYYFKNAETYLQYAPQVIESELQQEYRNVGVDSVVNALIDDGAKVLYHRVNHRALDSVDSLARFEA